MHEFELCESIMETVERRAAGRRVARVRVRVGVLHRVVGPALDQAFEFVAAGTVAEAAALDLVVVPVQVMCEACGHPSQSDDAVAVCPACGSTQLTMTAGDELILESLEIAAPG